MPLHSRLHPCSGLRTTQRASARSGQSPGGHGGRCGHVSWLRVSVRIRFTVFSSASRRVPGGGRPEAGRRPGLALRGNAINCRHGSRHPEVHTSGESCATGCWHEGAIPVRLRGPDQGISEGCSPGCGRGPLQAPAGGRGDGGTPQICAVAPWQSRDGRLIIGLWVRQQQSAGADFGRTDGTAG